MIDEQTTVQDLITAIEQATEAGSVSNLMVARIMRYATRMHAAISNVKALDSITLLPESPTDPLTAYIISGHIYLYVGTGGDTLDGLYQDCGEIRGPQGPVGPKGNDGVVLDGDAVTIFDDLSDLDGKTETEKAKMIPSGLMVETIEEAINGKKEVITTRSGSTSHVRIYASTFGLTAFPKGLKLVMLATNGGNLYARYDNGSTDNNQSITLTAGVEKTVTVGRDDITEYSIYKSGGNTFSITYPKTDGISDEVKDLRNSIDDVSAQVETMGSEIFDSQKTLSRTIDISSSTPRIEITPEQGGFSTGDSINIYLGDGLSSYKAVIYFFYTDGTYTNKGTYTRQEWKNILITEPSGKTFQKIRFVFKALSETTPPTISVVVERLSPLGVTLNAFNERINSASPNGVKVVVLGDSYSQMGYWINALKSYIGIDELNNFGVGGANLKDIYSRTAHPYTDRPYQGKVSANGTEYNENLINCQLEWLKRLVNNQCRGVYYEVAFTNATSDGSVVVSIGDVTYTVAVSAGNTASVIADAVAALDIPDYTLIHPTGKKYITIEAQKPEDTEMATITATGTTATKTKLRSAEKPIYQDGEYPDFVIVEAGKNDTPDTDAEVSAYMNDVLLAKTGYCKTTDGTAYQGTAYIPPTIEEVNRQTFCGELSYLVREIRALFPKSIMIVVGPTSLKAGNSGISNELKKDDQMRLACRYLNIPYVSWVDNGIINRVVNYPSGDGTQANPWIIDNSTFETRDMLHPNQRGGYKLGLAVAQKIRELISYRTLIKDY